MVPSIQLTNLPLEIIQIIITQVVLSIGLTKAVHLRNVNKLFDAIVQQVIMGGTIDFSEPKTIKALSDPLANIFKSKLLYERTIHGYRNQRGLEMPSALLETIRGVIRSVTGNSAGEEREKTYMLCQLAVDNMNQRNPDIDKEISKIDCRLFDKEDIFVAAACLGDLDRLKKMRRESNIDFKTSNSFTFGRPIVAAAGQGHVEVVRYLMQRGFWYWDYVRPSALMTAAKGGHLEVVQLLVEEFDVKVSKATLQYAVQGGNMAALQLVLDYRIPKISHTHLMKFVLNEVCKNGPSNMAELAFEHRIGKHILKSFPMGCSALLWAVQSGRFRIVQVLLKNGADPNCHFVPRYPLLEALKGGFNKIVRELFKHGAKFRSKGDRFHSRQYFEQVLWHIVNNNDLDTMRMLCETGLKYHLSLPFQQRVMHMALKDSKREMANMLLRMNVISV